MKLLRHKFFWYGASLIALDFTLFGTTDATKAPSIVVIIGFGSVMLTIYVALVEILSFIGLYGLNLPHRRQLAIYISVLLGGLLALQSIGELDRRDVLVWLPLIIVGYAYSAYAKPSRRNLES
jgi:hypothetical protein